MLATQNKHEYDSRIRFREQGHVYWIDDDSTDIISSTTFIHKFVGGFDSDKVIQKMINSHNYKNNPDYKYYQMPPEDIKQMWKTSGQDASRAGTELHADIENFYNGVEVTNDSKEYKYFLNFHRDHKDLKIYRTEWCVFSEVLKITGSIDAVFINPDGSLSIYDWKRSKKISFNAYGGKRMLPPFQHLQDCNFYHYSLQLNLYCRLLEKIYGKKVRDMFLVVCYPENKNYIKIPVKRMDYEIDLLFDSRISDMLELGYPVERFADLGIEYEYVTESDEDEENDEENEIIVKHKRLPLTDR